MEKPKDVRENCQHPQEGQKDYEKTSNEGDVCPFEK